MFGKKRLARRMIQTIDGIKVVLYKILTDDFSKKHEDIEYCKNLAATIVNEIFDCHEETTRQRYGENIDLVEEEIRNLGINHPDLKQPLTHAITVWVTANTTLGSENMSDPSYGRELILKAMNRGIFITDGEMLDFNIFMNLDNELARKYINKD